MVLEGENEMIDSLPLFMIICALIISTPLIGLCYLVDKLYKLLKELEAK